MAKQRPNILIVMADQHQAGVTLPGSGCPTPNVEQLAEEGVRFVNAYTIAAHCCPARASFMTGLYPSRHGIFNNVTTPTALRTALSSQSKTWSEILKNEGYNLSYTGKWHVTIEEGPDDRGWRPFGTVTSTEKDEKSTYDKPPYIRQEIEKNLINSIWIERDGYPDVFLSGTRKGTIEQTLEYKQSMDAIAELKRLAKKSDPWCLYIGWDGPHDPYAVPEPYASTVDPKTVPLPESYGDDLMDRPAIYRRQKQLWDKLSVDDVKQTIARYWGYCSMLDHLFGMILKELEKSGQAENTIVIFTSDHGDLLGAHGLFLKGIPPYEEAYKIPLVIRWPKGIQHPGRTSNSIARILDIGSTLLDAVCAPPLPSVDGESLVPILFNKEDDGKRNELYCQMNGVELFYTQRIMRIGRYKYVFNGFDFDEFYDLENDPFERRNLINNPELKNVRRELLVKLWKWAEKTEDFIENSYPTVALVPIGPYPRLRKG